MLEKMILDIYLGPSINGVYWVRGFTKLTLPSSLQRLARFFPPTLDIVGIPSYVARLYNGSPLDPMRTRDKVCLYMHNFIFFMYS